MPTKKTAKKPAKKNSLVENINRKKKAGTGRSKKNSTVSKEAHGDMQKGWPARKASSANQEEAGERSSGQANGGGTRGVQAQRRRESEAGRDRRGGDTPDKMRRKASFLRRHFANLRGPLVDDRGKPTRLALSAHAWREPVPKTKTAGKKLADKGAALLEKYRKSKDKPTKKR